MHYESQKFKDNVIEEISFTTATIPFAMKIKMKNSLQTYPISPIPTMLMDLIPETGACNKQWRKPNFVESTPSFNSCSYF